MAVGVAIGLAVVRSAAGRRGRQGRLAARRDRVGGIILHARVSLSSVPEDRLPVILVHGLGMSSRYMIPLAEHLAPHLRVYAPDLPGFGLSDKPAAALTVRQLADALAAWMHEVGVKRAAFVGNSLGCEVLVELALVHPQLVDRLVLQGPTPDPEARGIARQVVGFFLIAPFERWSLAWVALTDYARSGVRRYLQTLRSMVDNHIGEKASRVFQPTLVVWGTRDHIVPYAFVTSLAASLPRGALAVIPGAAHGINYSHPEAFKAAVLPFLLPRETSGTHHDRSEHSDGRGTGRRAGPQGPRA
ncbi:pimeloyl-ACP methyl ester carboxylesterase [Methylorubrum rhodinum]|uniref:Pimeloyl-ACP methyl ester carboxylesterase n=1 Tax=Methylorubrum rhodinum TaxID=29428 RepID=A0A840ZU50_9HYPH|nr:alpha/beta hydrolase [Methylorubrum rhodinum]MBB5760357.1 pimeloyl-ACP methyl ester carboxylesterase [Methylorubrum rhodinum]